jgi:hypothetical protein
MAKKALLIGVTNYGNDQDYQPLKAPKQDVELMKEVLENHDIGDFDQVIPLIDPNFAEATRTLCSKRTEINAARIIIII